MLVQPLTNNAWLLLVEIDCAAHTFSECSGVAESFGGRYVVLTRQEASYETDMHKLVVSR